MFPPISSKLSVQKVLLCPFNCKPRPSGVSLTSVGQENIRQVPGNRAKVAQNHDARKAISATLSVLKWSGAIFRSKRSKISVQKVLVCPFCCTPWPSILSLESLGLENIPQVPANWPKVGPNYDPRKAVLSTLSVLKWNGAIFWPISSKVSVEKVLLCPYHCKPRPSGVTLESQALENIPQVSEYRHEAGQKQDARKAVSATLSVSS